MGSDTWASDPNGDSSTTDQLTTDQRGFGRKMGTGGVGTVDIGAYETGIIVTSLEDDGAGSLLTLREALANSQALTNGEIVFDPSLFAVTTDSLAGPDTIVLDQGQLVANSNVTITGPGKDVLLIDAHQASRVIEISSGKSVAIRGLTLMGGKVTGSNRGGGIYVSGNLTLDSAVVRDNEAIDQGGGIYVANPGTVHIVDSTISDNVSAQGGAIKSKSSAENAVVIEGSAVINNSATTFGGIFISGDAGAGTKTAKIVNSTFSGNTVTSTDGNGGAIAVNSGFSLTVINSTITDNHAGTGTGSGGGIWNGATVTLYNTILAGNAAGNSTTSDAYASMSAASSYNLIGQNVNVDGSGDGTGTIKLGSGQTAGLAPLADNGGPTLTHRLEKGSQAINAGSDTHVTSSMTMDQRGFTRKVNQTANQLETDDPDHEDEGTVTNDQVDMGAYELGLVVTTWYDEGYLYNSDFGPTLSLREALHAAEHMLPQDDDITFDVDVFATNRTITLGVSEYGNVWEHEESAEDQAEDLRELTDLGIDSNVRIVGPGAMKLTIDAASKEKIDAYAELVEDDLETEDVDESHIEGIRVFYIGDHDSRNHLDNLIRTKDEDPTNPNFEWVTASISGLTITGGRLESSTPGGGVYNGGALTIDEVILRDNYTFLWGGGLFATGDTIIRSSIVDSNRAAGDTGAYSGGVSARGFVEVIQNTTADGEQLNLIRPGALTIVDSQFTNNVSVHAGAFDAEDGANTVRVHNSTFTGNYSARVYEEDLDFTAGVGAIQIRGFDYADEDYSYYLHGETTVHESRDLMLGGWDMNVYGRVQALIT